MPTNMEERNYQVGPQFKDTSFSFNKGNKGNSFFATIMKLRASTFFWYQNASHSVSNNGYTVNLSKLP